MLWRNVISKQKILNLVMLSSRKKFYVIKHTYSLRLRVCVSTYDLLLLPGNKELKWNNIKLYGCKNFGYGKIFSSGKIFWSRETLCFWKTSLIVENFFLVKRLPNDGKIVLVANFLNRGKTSLIKEDFHDCGKISDCRKLP